MRALLLLLMASAIGGLFGYIWSSGGRPAPKALILNNQPPSATVEKTRYFASCSEARDAGAAPLYSGQPGYRTEFDPDGDGIACQPGAAG
jgi:Excalibur calcium-binding domain